MIKHILFFRFIDKSDETAKTAYQKIGELRKIAAVKDISYGLDVVRRDRSYDMALEIVFENMDKLREYTDDPIHVEFGKYIHSVTESIVSVDYEF